MRSYWYSSGQKFCSFHKTSIASHSSPIWGTLSIACVMLTWLLQLLINQRMVCVPHIGVEWEVIEIFMIGIKLLPWTVHWGQRKGRGLKVRSHEWFCSAQVLTVFRLFRGVTVMLSGGKGPQSIPNYLFPLPILENWNHSNQSFHQCG